MSQFRFRATGPAPVDVLVLGAGWAGTAAAATVLGLDVDAEGRVVPVPEGAAGTGSPRVALVDGAPVGRGGWDGRTAVAVLAATAATGADWAGARRQLLDARREAQARHSARLAALRESAGHRLTVVAGRARFVGPSRVLVEPRGAVGSRPVELRGRKVLVATGSLPALPEATGLGETRHVTVSELDLLMEEDAPSSVAVIGAGSSGCATAQALARLGVAVTLVEAAPRVLPREDRDVAAAVERGLQGDGVRVVVSSAVATLAPTLDGGAWFGAREGGDIAAERLVLATGWHPATGGLQAPLGGVPLTPGGAVSVDDRLVAGTGDVLAAGSVTGSRPHCEEATAMGRLAGANAGVRKPRLRRSGTAAPYLTCTDPPVARVGLSTRETSGALEAAVGRAGTETGTGGGGRVRAAVADRDPAGTGGRPGASAETQVGARPGTDPGTPPVAWSTTPIGPATGAPPGVGDGPEPVLVRVVTASDAGRSRGGDLLLGVTVVGPGAAELIALPALALQAGLPASNLRRLVGAGASGTAALRRALGAVREPPVEPRRVAQPVV